MYRLTDYGAMLRDRRRVDAYTRALRALVTPHTTLLDLGTGLGTFSILACKLGAARVYAVESMDVIAVAEELARANGVAERITFIQARGLETELPERVDVVVSDLSGALPIFEEHLPTVIHAREHFLKPGGALIPQRDRLWCAPVSSEALYSTLTEPWKSVPNVDLGPAMTMALNAAHAVAVRPEHLAAEPIAWAELDYATLQSPHVRGDAQWTMRAAATIHGIALWFESMLHDDITHSSGPWWPDSVHATMLLPLVEPLSLREGEALRCTIESTLVAGRYITTWQINDAPRQSTFLSQPRSRASLTDRHASRTTGAAPRELLRVSERVLSRRVGDELLLLDLDSGTYHVLNETGARVWELLQSGDAIDAIATTVAAEYEVDAQQAADDVAEIVARLQEERLIVRAAD